MGQIAHGVKGVMVQDGYMLVLLKPDGVPDLPGGRLEGEESYEEALYREMMEETGIEIKILKPITRWSFMKRPELEIKGMTYLCQPVRGDLRLSPEHSDYRWTNWSELRKVQFNKPYLRRDVNDASYRL